MLMFISLFLSLYIQKLAFLFLEELHHKQFIDFKYPSLIRLFWELRKFESANFTKIQSICRRNLLEEPLLIHNSLSALF